MPTWPRTCPYTQKAQGDSEWQAFQARVAGSGDPTTSLVGRSLVAELEFYDEQTDGASIGLHTGRAKKEADDFFGEYMILASRIAAKAEGGEILVADTVRGLCSGKGFLFADRGEFVAKGFEEPVRVYEVRWRDG